MLGSRTGLAMRLDPSICCDSRLKTSLASDDDGLRSKKTGRMKDPPYVTIIYIYCILDHVGVYIHSYLVPCLKGLL